MATDYLSAGTITREKAVTLPDCHDAQGMTL